MKIRQQRGKRSQEAYALIIVMVIGLASVLIFASAVSWTYTSSGLNNRNNVYNSAVAAAEAATENVLTHMARDFFTQTFDTNNLDSYRKLVPTNGWDWAAAYRFGDGAGEWDRTWVQSTYLGLVLDIDPQFKGLFGYVYNCSVRSSAKPLEGWTGNIVAAVQQDFQLQSIPAFQLLFFYMGDLEINPGPDMKVTGKVHSNRNIYTCPGATLEYVDMVTASGTIFNKKRHPDDPTSPANGTLIYDMAPDAPKSGQSSLTLPIGTNNTPAAVRQILETPPPGESPYSDMGRQRFYNQTDLIITVTDSEVDVKAGTWDSFTSVNTDTNTGSGYSFVNTNASFWDQREQKWTTMTDIDVGKFNKWMTNAGANLNVLAQFRLNHQLDSIYVDDQRSSATKLTAVRVSDGQKLPPDGLTVATKLPLYVQGQYNAPNITPGLTNTINTRPAALAGDSITILSAGWSDNNSTAPMPQRNAVDTTVNAAFLAGIVETTSNKGGKHYSGGVENFPRFLEDWNKKSLTYNGSMVVLFPSQFATNFWGAPGGYYNAPNRLWAFDLNFLVPTKMPPVTPRVVRVERKQWRVVAAQ